MQSGDGRCGGGGRAESVAAGRAPRGAPLPPRPAAADPPPPARRGPPAARTRPAGAPGWPAAPPRPPPLPRRAHPPPEAAARCCPAPRPPPAAPPPPAPPRQEAMSALPATLNPKPRTRPGRSDASRPSKHHGKLPQGAMHQVPRMLERRDVGRRDTQVSRPQRHRGRRVLQGGTCAPRALASCVWWCCRSCCSSDWWRCSMACTRSTTGRPPLPPIVGRHHRLLGCLPSLHQGCQILNVC